MPVSLPHFPRLALLGSLCAFAFSPPVAGEDLEADVVVYGGNAAGIAAAIQTSRMGYSVVVLEPGRHFGGMTTGGLGATDTGAKESVGGIAREFYQRLYQYYQQPGAWHHETRAEFVPRHRLAVSEELGLHWFFEPHVATRHLREMMKEAGVSVLLESRLDRSPGGVSKVGSRIVSIRLTDGRIVRGRMFIDTTYEGDLMAAAGVSYRVGRESNATYGETLNGIVYLPARRTAHIDPWLTPGDPSSGLLPGILPEPPGPEGEGDGRTQAYNYRVCLTDEPSNRVPFSRPERYDPLNYELVLRHVLGTNPLMLPGNDVRNGLFTLTPMPNRKTDSNNKNLFSTDFIGRSWDWAEASYEERERIRQEHEDYVRGLFWFLANDPRVPQALREAVNRWGLAADEFTDNGNWPTQLYVREARRMIGMHVVTEHDCLRTRSVDDGIALASYAMDSHCVSMFVDGDGKLRLEGAFFKSVRPYPVSYRAILPQPGEADNLLVPVCLSSSHVAYGSMRMEPVFMMLAQSAATAAVMALSEGVDLRDIPYPSLRDRLVADGQILDTRQAARPPATAAAPVPVAQPAPAPAPAPTTQPAPAAETPAPAQQEISEEDRQLATTLVRLEQLGLIDGKVYWFVNARRGSHCDGEKVAALIIAAANRLQPGTRDIDAALEVMVRRRVLTKVDTWKRLAQPGQACPGRQVASLLSRIAQSVR